MYIPLIHNLKGKDVILWSEKKIWFRSIRDCGPQGLGSEEIWDVVHVALMQYSSTRHSLSLSFVPTNWIKNEPPFTFCIYHVKEKIKIMKLGMSNSFLNKN